MDIKEYLLDEMRERMEMRARSYAREGIEETDFDLREEEEKEDVARGFHVYDLYCEMIRERDWYPGDRAVEGTDFEERMAQLFTSMRYFELQFESVFIMNYDEGGYDELTENDERYWADHVIKQLEKIFKIDQFVADNYK